MARSTPVQNSLAGGEISPLLDAAADLDWYAASARLLQNVLVQQTRGVAKRGGTRYVAAAKYGDRRSAVRPFVFNAAQAYALEIGDQYLRFFKDQGRIEIAATDAAIVNGDFAAGIASWTSRSTGAGAIAWDATNNRLNLNPGGTDVGWAEQAVAVGLAYRTNQHVLKFRVVGAPGDFIECRIGTTSTGGELLLDRQCHPGWHTVSFTPNAATVYIQFRNDGAANNDFASLNKILAIDDVAIISGAPLEIGSPYTVANLFTSAAPSTPEGRLRIKYTQSNDVLYLCHVNYPVYKLARSGHQDWALSQLAFLEGPMLDENAVATQMQVSAATGPAVTLTATATKGINQNDGFKLTDIGRIVRLKVGTNPYGWGVIVGWTSTTVVSIDVRSTFTGAATNTTKWALGQYSDTDGWPTSTVFFEERQEFAGVAARPNRFTGSASGDFETFTPGVADADPVDFTIASDQANPIVWMAPLNKLMIGTADEMADMMPVLPGGGGGFAVSGPNNGVITPTTVEVKKQSADVALYVERHGRELRELSYQFNVDGYLSEPMSIRAAHLQRGGIVDVAWQNKPGGILYQARADGLLLAFTYQRTQKITAWAREPLGGYGQVESLCCIPGDGADEPWLMVHRTINGADVRYIELLTEPLNDETSDPIQSFYVDCGLTFDGAQAATLTPGAGATVAGTTGVTFTAGAAIFAGTSADHGREIRYRIAADPDAFPPIAAIEARALITGHVDTTHVTATIQGAFPSLSAIAAGAWRLSSLSASGLNHLEGQTVQILADGAVHPTKVVTAGVVTFDFPVTYAAIGLGMSARVLPTKFEPPTQEGPSLGKIKRVSDVTVRLYRTLGLKIGRDEATLSDQTFRDFGNQMDLALPLLTGDFKCDFNGDYDRNADILIGSDDPLPFTLLAIMAVVTVGEGG